MILITTSESDVASKNILDKLLEKNYFEKLTTKLKGYPLYEAEIEGKKVNLVILKTELSQTQKFFDSYLGVELIIFISRHSSESGTPTLSVHPPGNLGKAQHGGIPRKVSVAPSNAMKNALMEMARQREEKKLDYEVTYECTHHGPSLNTPSMFIELGSSMKNWKDTKAAEAVAQAAVKAVSDSKYPAAIGIGGPHYNEKFTRMALESTIAFSHIIPKYAVPVLDVEIIRHCLERSVEVVEFVILDWKGIRSKDKEKLCSLLQTIDVRVKKV